MIEPEFPCASRHETLSLTIKNELTKSDPNSHSNPISNPNPNSNFRSINRQQDIQINKEIAQNRNDPPIAQQPQSKTRLQKNVTSSAIKVTLGRIFINSTKFQLGTNNKSRREQLRYDHLTYSKLNCKSSSTTLKNHQSRCRPGRFAFSSLVVSIITLVISAILVGSVHDFIRQAAPQANPEALEHNSRQLFNGTLNQQQLDEQLQFANINDVLTGQNSRACITATYLCVLIVNNTWIDCKLLESLCNNGNDGVDGRKQAELHERAQFALSATTKIKSDYPSAGRSQSRFGSDDNDNVDSKSAYLSSIDWHNLNEFNTNPVERRQREGRATWQTRSSGLPSELEIPLQDDSNYRQRQQQQLLVPVSSSRRTKAIINQDFESSQQQPTASPLTIATSVADLGVNNIINQQESADKQQHQSDLTSRTIPHHDDRSIGFSQYLNVFHGFQRGSSNSVAPIQGNGKDSSQSARDLQAFMTLTNNHSPGSTSGNIISPMSTQEPITPSASLVRLDFDDNLGNNNLNHNASTATTQTTTPSMTSPSCCDYERPATLMSNDVNSFINEPPPETQDNSQAISGFLPSWMRVPFRWGSISIWPSSFSHNNQHEGDELKSSSSSTDIEPVATIQILRPIDRGLNAIGDLQQQQPHVSAAISQITQDFLEFNQPHQRPSETFIGNQTTFNQHYASQQQQQHIQPYISRPSQGSTQVSRHPANKQANFNNIIQSSDQERDLQHLPLQSFQSSKSLLARPHQQHEQMSELQNNPNPSYSNIISQQQQQQQHQSSLMSHNQFDNMRQKNVIANEQPQQQQVVEHAVGCECDSMYPLVQNSVEMQQQSFNRQMTNRNGLVLSLPSFYSDCRVQCILQNQQQQLSSQETINNQNNQNMPMTSSETSSSPMTASISSPSSTTIPSSSTLGASTPTPTPGKVVPPLEVNFILYTRHHRDLAYKFAINQLTKSGSASASVAAATVTTTPESITTIASQQLMLGGELIDLTSETTTPSSGSDDKLSMQNNNLGNVIINNQLALNSSQSIKMIIHGFGSGARRPWVADMVYKLLEYEDVIVIVVDWEKGATLPNYVQAAGNTRLVGHKIANFIKAANVKFGFTGHQYHLIGFSLGAHVAGFAGMECNNTQYLLPRIVIQRITGLDPASPLFEGYEPNDRLDPTDAKFVDVIHSNGDGVLRGGFGSLQPMGHVDFYPNGGRVQVGCNSVLLSALSDIIYGKWQSLCNHRRALNFFMDSFEYAKCRFRSFKCDSYESYVRGECFDCGHNNEGCSYMGYRANQSRARGKMYLTTHEEAPFCANQFIIKLIGTKGYKTTWGKIEVTLVTLDGKNESFWLSPSLNRDRDLRSQATQLTMSPQSVQSSQPQASISSTPASQSPIIGNSIINNNSQQLQQQQSASATSINLATPTISTSNNIGPSITANNANNPNSDPSSAFNSIASNNNNNISKDETRPSGSQMSLQSLIVAHPSLANFTQVLLRYTRYKGWIYSGDESWSIDKVFIMDSDGQVKSFCGPNTILESHITTRVNLESGNCTVTEPPCCSNSPNGQAGSVPTHRVAGLASSSSPSSPSPAMGGMQSDEPQLDPTRQLNSHRQSSTTNTNGGGGNPRLPRLYATILHNNNQNNKNLESLGNFKPTLEPLQLVAGTSGHAFQRFAPLTRDRSVGGTQSASLVRPIATAATTTTTTTTVTGANLASHQNHNHHNYLAQHLVAQQQFAQQMIQPNQNQQQQFNSNNNLFLAF